MAQLAEQLICNQQVIGSSPIIGFQFNNTAGWSSLEARRAHNPKVTGSNPVPAIYAQIAQLVEQLICNQQVIGSSPIIGFQFNNTAGWSSLEARRAHNPKVTGSNPVPAIYAQIAQLVEQRTENPRVAGSIPALGISFWKVVCFPV